MLKSYYCRVWLTSTSWPVIRHGTNLKIGEKKMITTDKIRYNIGEYLWNFWQNNNDIESIKNAEKILRSEIEDGLRRRFQDFCEYQLLCNKLGIENKLNLESEERK